MQNFQLGYQLYTRDGSVDPDRVVPAPPRLRAQMYLSSVAMIVGAETTFRADPFFATSMLLDGYAINNKAFYCISVENRSRIFPLTPQTGPAGSKHAVVLLELIETMLKDPCEKTVSLVTDPAPVCIKLQNLMEDKDSSLVSVCFVHTFSLASRHPSSEMDVIFEDDEDDEDDGDALVQGVVLNPKEGSIFDVDGDEGA